MIGFVVFVGVQSSVCWISAPSVKRRAQGVLYASCVDSGAHLTYREMPGIDSKMRPDTHGRCERWMGGSSSSLPGVFVAATTTLEGVPAVITQSAVKTVEPSRTAPYRQQHQPKISQPLTLTLKPVQRLRSTLPADRLLLPHSHPSSRHLL